MAFCRKCGGDLDSDGTCAMCMLAGGLDPQPDEIAAGTTTLGMTAAFETLEISLADLESDSFGPYSILRVLGEGGMGAVYLAEQTRPLHRQVALKVVKLGLSSTEVLSRFNYERQALALMDHPNIARVYDAGESDNGRPYFAMEYVDGLPITTYCDRRRLTTRERLGLFIPVCLALQHAHQKGVIHRDIKPSNVMIAEVDEHPVPKVIDFGIARATEQRIAECAAFTQFGQFLGTPEYMSPEQADLVTGDVDTSSDVYSLGVLLYELLIGAVPFDPEMLRQVGLSELLRIIREVDAIPMTAKLTRMGDAASEVAGHRGTDPATLHRLVSGDLNWIVMRAMEKDRRRRYPAASELAADIRRHLDDQPVLASPPSALYRARKFVRRHRLPVIAATAVLLALVAGIVATTWQAAIARRERAEAVVARTLAEARLNDVHALADSMLFEINDDVKDLAGGTKAREALVRLGQQYLNKEAATQTDPRRRRELAEAFVKVGDLQGAPGESNLRDVSGARQSYSRSVAILEADVVSQPRDPGLRHLMTLAYVRQAQLEESASSAKTFGAVVPTFATSWAQLDQSASAAATMLERASKSADIYLAQWPADPQGLRDRCEVLQAKDEFAPAVELRQRILAASPNDPVLRWELAHAQIAFGSSLVLKNRRKALDWLQRGAAACDLLNKEDPANVRYLRDRAVALGSMTRVLLNLSRLNEAVACAHESVSILEQLTASDRRSASFRLDLSAARVALSNAYYDSGQASLALENVARAAAVQEDQAARYPDNPDFPRQAAYNFRNAGRFKSYMKDFQGALEQYRKAEAIDRKLVARYPDRHELSEALRGDLDSIASSLLGLGDNSAALRAWRDALAISHAASAAPSNSQPSGESLVSLAMAHQGVSNGLRALSRWDEAIVEQRAAIAIWERRVAGKPDNQGLQRARSRSLEDLSRLYEGHGDFRAAVAASERARLFLAVDFAAHPDDESALTELRNALLCLRTQYARIADYDRAIAAARQVVEMTKSTGMISRTAANRDLGDTLLLSGRRADALASFRRAVATMDDTHIIPGGGPSYPIEKEPSSFYRNELASTFLSLVTAFTSARREEESAALLKRLLPVLENLARANPGNDLYRETLLRAYRSAALAFLGLGDLTNSLDFEQKGLRLEPSSPTPGRAAYERAVRLARTASLQFRLGSRDAAQKTWREALARFQQAANDSKQQWSADHQDLDAHDTLAQAELGAAFALENLGGPQQTQPVAAGIMDTFASPIPARLAAAAKSLDVARRRMTSDPSTPNRLALARALQSQADALRAAARCGKGTESISAYRQSRDHYAEALAILNSLKPSAPVADLITLTNHLSDADERLR